MVRKDHSGAREHCPGNAHAGICAGGARQARRLLDAPPADTLKGLRDRAILAVLLYHGLTRQELCRLATGDLVRSGAGFQLRVTGSRARVLAVHPEAVERIEAWLEGAGQQRSAEPVLPHPTSVRSQRRSQFPVVLPSLPDANARSMKSGNSHS